MEQIKTVLQGVAIGLANIIPGVSGGTMALMLGIYERLIGAVHNIGGETVLSLFRGRKALVQQLRRIDAVFLACIGVGALAAVVGAAKLLLVLLTRHHDPTYGFFFGLVLMSLFVPYRMIRRLSPGVFVSALLAAGLVLGLTLAMSGERQVESARRKAELKAVATAGQTPAVDVPPVAHDPATLGFLFVAGVVAISAMILPGISGSFMLLLMGVYFDILACVVGRQLVPLGVFALGCLVGLLAFTRLINFALQRFHDLTLGFLLGLVLGSLYAIWPFKAFQDVAGKRVDLHNMVPRGFGSNEALTLVAMLVGCAIVAVFLWLDRRPGAPLSRPSDARA